MSLSSINSNKFIKICDIAKEVLKKSNMPMKLGSCVIYKGKVISTGFNHTTRSYISGFTFPAIHAEMSAISSFLTKIKSGGMSYKRKDR